MACFRSYAFPVYVCVNLDFTLSLFKSSASFSTKFLNAEQNFFTAFCTCWYLSLYMSKRFGRFSLNMILSPD